MSNAFARLLGADDPREVELVRKIREKTESKKILWAKTPSAYVAGVRGMQISFVRSPGMFAHGTWQLFTVRNDEGEDILKVENAFGGLLVPQPPPSGAPSSRTDLLGAVSELFAVVSKTVQGDVDRAIGVIDNL